ncbi:MAG: trypsin-like peptidase domain-containing protein, partial [Pyrinomonadaceae bacterium]
QGTAKVTPSPEKEDDIMDFLRRQMAQRPIYGVGSGFIVDRTGYILTNAHVIDGASRITVKLDSGEEFPATVLGSDDETDLAVLKIDAKKDLPFLKFGNSEKAEVGDWVLAIGSPFGLTKTVTAGIISQTRRETPYATAFQRFIQTDAAINRGNSGGPLVNMDGDVIGVNSQIATSTGDYNGVGFALPSHEAENVYKQISTTGKVRRGYLGVLLDSVKTEYAAIYGLKDAGGAIVTDVRDKRGPAGAAGIEVGDVITEVNGQKVDSAQDLISKIATAGPDSSIAVGYFREVNGKMMPMNTTIKLGERPASRDSNDFNQRRPLPVEPNKESKPFGLTLVEMTPALATTAKLDGQKGLLVKEISPTSFIADVRTSNGNAALSENDLIRKINRVAATDLRSFNEVVNKLKPGDPVVMEVVVYNPATGTPQLKIVQFTVQ